MTYFLLLVINQIMKHATFYLFKHKYQTGTLSAYEAVACAVAVDSWRHGKRSLIACDNYEQAQRLDQALWQSPPYTFVPHNLAGEGPDVGAPVELCWPDLHSNTPRDLLITLQLTFVNFATEFHKVIDFIPCEELLKQIARNRYKLYRSIGFHVTIVVPPTHLTII